MVDEVGRVLAESEGEAEMNGAGGDTVGRWVGSELPYLIILEARPLVELGRLSEGENGAARIESDGGERRNGDAHALDGLQDESTAVMSYRSSRTPVYSPM